MTEAKTLTENEYNKALSYFDGKPFNIDENKKVCYRLLAKESDDKTITMVFSVQIISFENNEVNFQMCSDGVESLTFKVAPKGMFTHEFGTGLMGFTNMTIKI